MKVNFVNHASFVLEFDAVKVICDPWLEGSIFQEGWSLLVPTLFTYEDFKDITHIWFSHEHPDHFFPPNIKKIPEAYRKNITVIFKKTEDKKVVNFCSKLGFKIFEINTDKWTKLTENISLYCSISHDDSCLAIKNHATNQCLLNVNDCLFDNNRKLKSLQKNIGQVDVLCSQFSYASYCGATYEERKKTALRKLDELDTQIAIFNPKYLIPLASYVWFSHEENYYLNDAVNTAQDIWHYYEQKKTVVLLCLFPNEQWKFGAAHNSENSVQLYKPFYEDLKNQTLSKPKSFEVADLKIRYETFCNNVKTKTAFSYFIRLIYFVKPLVIKVSDLDIICKIGVRRRDFVILSNDINYDLIMSSDVLNYCLTYDWGFNTTSINGRFSVHSPDALQKLGRFITIGDAMNHNRVSFLAIIEGVFRRAKRFFNKITVAVISFLQSNFFDTDLFL